MMSDFLSPQPFLHPELNYQVQVFMRMAYGVLLILTLAWALPQWRRFFLGERWGGYGQAAWSVEVIQNPYVMPVIFAVWFSCGGLITAGVWSPWPEAINYLFCRYFFISMRWNGLMRGMGAPGFVCYWSGMALFFLEYSTAFAPELRPLLLQVLQVDFACIYLSAGYYKYSSGYPKNHGMELGMVNPAWGYWWRTFKALSPSHVLFKTLNHLAWASQILAGILMLFPPTRFIGGSIIILMFLFIATQIRLAWLCEMVMLCSGLIFFHPGSLGDQWIAALVGPHTMPASGLYPWLAPINTLFEVALYGYLVCVPLAHLGLSYNFYLKRTFPRLIQRVLERFTNLFGLIVWRVFSVDIVNFFARIYVQPKSGGEPTLVSKYVLSDLRYFHVAESITLACLFNTRRYYSSNWELFKDRLIRYAKTVPRNTDSDVIIEFVYVKKDNDQFTLVPAAEYVVDVVAQSVTERVLDSSISVSAADAVSPVHEGTRPGTYVPIGSR